MTNTTNIVHSSSNLGSSTTSQQKDSCTVSMTGEELMKHLAKSNKKKKSTAKQPLTTDNEIEI